MRLPLVARVVAVLCSFAALSTASAVLLVDRTLSRDLRGAASASLARAADSAELLVQTHLRGVQDRYAAIAGTPQLREMLASGDLPALRKYAEELRQHEGARVIGFVDRERAPLVFAGEAELWPLAEGVVEPELRTHGGRAYAIVNIGLDATQRQLGWLVTIEPIDDEHLRSWSLLCGADLHLARDPDDPDDAIWRQVRDLRETGLWVRRSLAPEQEWLRNSRADLLSAGALALAVAIAISVLISRRVVGFLVQLRNAAARIGKGEFDLRLPVKSRDEIGALCESLNEMAEQLQRHDSQFALRNRELEEVNSELEEVNRALSSANAAKSEFLANMSHEIRTPMTAILGYADELLEGSSSLPVPADRLSAIDAIHRNGQHLLQIINDILDLSKIEAGRLNIEELPFSPVELVSEVKSLMDVRATERGLTIETDFATPLSDTIEGDPTRMRQVLINLLGNAIKFTEEGTIWIVLRQPSGDRIQFEVIDPGIGMSPEQLAHLFKPFTQADSSTTRVYGGTGLGLSISHRLVALMGGSIEVESTPGQGSSFKVTLPASRVDGEARSGDADRAKEAKRVAESAAPADTSAPARLELDCRILLAEDGPDNQRLIRAILERAGAQVEIVSNGRAAHERAIEANNMGEPFDVILMDMQMPILDGYDATRVLRSAGYELPIIALTAHAMASDRERCLEVGCDDFASKPIDRSALLGAIHSAVTKTRC